MSGRVRRLRHAKVELALHELRPGSGRALLLLHGLGERTPEALPEACADWPGPVFGLDFTGHGASTLPEGGGYTAEVLMADADAALREIGEATVVGRGLGAWVALMIAGARAETVRGAVLRDGLGLAGGGPRPGTPQVLWVDPDSVRPPDPFALLELGRDIRPPDYATTFARLATQFSGLDRPLTVCTAERPDWLRAVVQEPGVEESSADEALRHYAQVA